MKKIEILQRDAPLLREKAKPVSKKDIKSKKILDVINRMKKALHNEHDGVAIAAPQIGESLRIFVVSGKALVWDKKRKGQTHRKNVKDLVFINPEIIKASKKRKELEEGCLSVRWLYGFVSRSEKVTLKALDESGKEVERGASGLLAQIFQHEVDHLDGVLFTDKATDLHDAPPKDVVRYIFFGGSPFSYHVLDELEDMGLVPLLHIDSTDDIPSIEELGEFEADVFVVASFGKILPKELVDLPRYKSVNVHPSLLPELRGPSPIQNLILGRGEPGVTIIRMDDKVDHGPILAQIPVPLNPWPDHYESVEEKLGRVGGRILGVLLPKLIKDEIEEKIQDDKKATFTKLVKKEDGLIDLKDSAMENLRKVLAYSTWPGAHMIYTNKRGKEIRLVIKDAKIIDNKFTPTRVIPAGKREMSWEEFLRGN